jgi:RNA recognition motif-containing protein
MLFSKFGNIRSLKIKKPDIRMNYAIVTTAYSIGYVDFEREEDAKTAI